MKIIFRKGMSFVEVVSSLVIVVLLCSLVVSSVSIFSDQSKKIAAYTNLRIYAIDLIERMDTDLENQINGIAGSNYIDNIDYNDDGYTSRDGKISGIKAEVVVTSIGNEYTDDVFPVKVVYGKETYFVEYTLRDLETDVYVKGSTVLRGGCTSSDG